MAAPPPSHRLFSEADVAQPFAATFLCVLYTADYRLLIFPSADCYRDQNQICFRWLMGRWWAVSLPFYFPFLMIRF